MNAGATWKRIIGYTKQHRGIAIAAVFCAILSVVASLIAPLLIVRTVDPMAGPAQLDFDQVLRLLLLLPASYFAGRSFGWLLTDYTNRIPSLTVYSSRPHMHPKLTVRH
ncbi:sugar ABC transporter ATP-binding protein, partial [Paenibacillus riograndensis]